MRDLIEKFSLMRDFTPRSTFATTKGTKGKQETYWNTGSFHQVGGVGGGGGEQILTLAPPQTSYWNTGAASIKWQV